MTDKIKIDIVSDVVCPWCIIGYERLQQAINELGIQDKVEINWQPFELNPDMEATGENLHAHMSHKYSMTPEESTNTLANMTQLGAEVGVRFDFFDEMKMVNTRESHILLEYAKDYGKQTELKLALFRAFFSDRKDVSDRKCLVRQLQYVGLNVDDALARLDDTVAREQLQKHEVNLRHAGISSVPTMFFQGANTLTGAQPVSVYKNVLADLLEH